MKNDKDKELLLKDLCARLPYGIKVDGGKNGICTLIGLEEHVGRLVTCYRFKITLGYPKPYLRPISSMTEKEWEEYHSLRYCDTSNADRVDFLNSHHLDYRGLIEKGLALEAPEDMYEI